MAVRVEVDGDDAGAVGFESVPAFAHTLDLEVEVEGYGTVSCDIAYGGAFYAVADAGRFGLEMPGSPVADLVRAADALSGAVRDRVELAHPDAGDLGYLYGSVLTDGREGGPVSANVCVFADSQVDRSPTGVGGDRSDGHRPRSRAGASGERADLRECYRIDDDRPGGGGVRGR